jgi:hypothetical protein
VRGCIDHVCIHGLHSRGRTTPLDINSALLHTLGQLWSADQCVYTLRPVRRSNSYERAGTIGFRCVKDVVPSTHPCPTGTAATGKAAVCGRWSGPPHAFTSLPAGSPQAWARWHVHNDTLQTTRSKQGAGLIGAPKPLCAGVSAVSTAGVSFPGIVGVNATAAAGSTCGFTLDVTTDGKGAQTLALFGSASEALSVTATARGVETSIVRSLTLTTNRSTARAAVDTHVHVTLDGAAGEVVTLKWWVVNGSQPPAPAPHQPFTYNYTELRGTACTVQHGAVAQLGSSAEVTAAHCQRRCDDDDMCSCAVFDPTSGQCKRMAQCIAPDCVADAKVSTFFKDYTVIDGLNCYGGHGATNIDVEPVPGLTLAQCADRCEADATCAGAVHSLRGPRKGDCWKRADIVLSQCAHVAFQSMLLRPTATTRSHHSPVALYGATLSRGGPPELPGYEA